MHWSKRAVPWKALLLALFFSRIGATSIETPERLPPDETVLPTPLHCPVDGEVVENREYGVMWQGRRYYMESEACVQIFMADPEAHARRIEPRAALYSAPRTDGPSYSPWVLYISLFVVLGLASGAVTSYVAVQKGLSGRNWFVLGLALNVMAIIMVFSCRGREMLFQKKGLCKTPQTHEPIVCANCGSYNHPSSSRCSGCNKAMDPAVQSEVARVN
jgi:YHS domain-containing protein